MTAAKRKQQQPRRARLLQHRERPELDVKGTAIHQECARPSIRRLYALVRWGSVITQNSTTPERTASDAASNHCAATSRSQHTDLTAFWLPYMADPLDA